jgi:hypothetical protein
VYAVGAALALALAQLRLIVLVFDNAFVRAAEAARGVFEGYPHWRIYQNRVLAPYLIEGLARVFPSYLSAYTVFVLATLVAAGVIAWRLGTRVAGPRGGTLALCAFHLGFALLLSRPWLYAWDYVDAIVFLVFVDFVVAEKRWPAFVPLVVVGVLNHEIASFVAAWLVADALVRWWVGRARGEKPTGAPGAQPAGAQLAWVQAAVGAGLFAASFVVVESLRSALLIEQIGPKLFTEAPPDIGSSFYLALGRNLGLVGKAFTEFGYSLPMLVPLLVIASLAVSAWLALREPVRFGGLALTYVGITASLVVFGAMFETRIYVVLLPLVILAATYAGRDDVR